MNAVANIAYHFYFLHETSARYVCNVYVETQKNLRPAMFNILVDFDMGVEVKVAVWSRCSLSGACSTL